MKKKTKILRTLLMMLSLIFVLSLTVSAAPKSQMVTQSDGYTYYYNSKGKIEKNKLVTYKKNTYGFNSLGRMYKNGLFTLKGKTYYATSKGPIAKNTFQIIEAKQYFFDSNGQRKTGWITYKNHKYYCPSSGTVYKSCWKKIGGYYYYFNRYRYIVTSRWVDGYYLNAKGHRVGTQLSESAQNAKHTKKTLSMKNIRQNPELPTGCESVALTMVLKYYKFNLGKTTIASQYLPKSGSGNFVTAFAGSPFSYSGCGIYSPGLTKTANSFLKAKHSDLKAYNYTGTSLTNLYKFIDDKTPVIVWNSMYMQNPIPSFSYYCSGKNWTFFTYEHCVVLCGYDKKNNKVLINDSLSGLVWRNKSSFERIYNKLGKMAVVIR